jgi:hypothetical protein
LVGGIQSVTLGDDEARRRRSQKSVLERKAPPTFDIAVEMLERQRWVIHEDVAATVDSLLRGQQPALQTRSVDAAGEVVVTNEAAKIKTPPLRGRSPSKAQRQAGGWRASGRMVPPQGGTIERLPVSAEQQSFEAMLDRSLNEDEMVYAAAGESLALAPEPTVGPNGEDILRVYSYGISKHHLDQVIATLRLPVVLTKDLDSADAVLALRSHVKHHSKLRHIAKVRDLPIHMVKSNSMPQIVRTLQRMLDMDDGSVHAMPNLSLFSPNEDADELEALEEARLAVEQIVIPKGQPVELLPRSARIRKMQHELAEHYRLKSCSFGDEPNRRLRIYPA